jgi:curved DNA-binding protein CbpA
LDDSIDYYSLLGVEAKATPEEIKRAYRKLVFQYHPDRNPDKPEAAEKLKHIMAAYDVLSNDESRAQYDKTRGSRMKRALMARRAQATALTSPMNSNKDWNRSLSVPRVR